MFDSHMMSLHITFHNLVLTRGGPYIKLPEQISKEEDSDESKK